MTTSIMQLPGLIFLSILGLAYRSPVYAVDLPVGELLCGGADFFIGHPDDLEDIRPNYYLLTRKNNQTRHKLDPRRPTTIKDSHFNPEDETVLISHGWRDNIKIPTTWTTLYKDQLLQKDNYNIILVDNFKALQTINYFQAINNNRVAAGVTADLVRALMEHGKLKLSKLHLIGHSLGAHHSGYVGHLVPGIRRITGLDPAGWCFENKPLEYRLDKTDADFVDIIHTSANMFFALGGMGYDEEIGHVDFYPNGGGFMPGCDKVSIFTILTGVLDLFQAFQTKHVCCHTRAVQYFYESINGECKYKAKTCKKNHPSFLGIIDLFPNSKTCDCGGKECNEMGLPASPLKNLGRQELTTNPGLPTCVANPKWD